MTLAVFPKMGVRIALPSIRQVAAVRGFAGAQELGKLVGAHLVALPAGVAAGLHRLALLQKLGNFRARQGREPEYHALVAAGLAKLMKERGQLLHIVGIAELPDEIGSAYEAGVARRVRRVFI